MATRDIHAQPQRARPRRLAAILAYRPQRSVWLPSIGIAAGLLAAGVGLFHRAPPERSTVPPGYVALVNQKGILLSDLMSQSMTELGKPFADLTPAERARVLHEMIDEELLVQRAVVLDLPETTTEVREAMTGGVNAQVAAPLLAEQPTDEQLRAYYDARRSKYTADGSMSVRDLVLHIGGYENADQSMAQAHIDATEAVYQLRAGTSVDYVREHFGFSDSERMKNGNEPDFAAKLHLGDTLYAVAAKLNEGEVSDPVSDADGLHVLIMERRRLPTTADFASARGAVYADYREDVSKAAQHENVRILRGQAQIILAPGESE
jgi:hypothetical protein